MAPPSLPRRAARPATQPALVLLAVALPLLAGVLPGCRGGSVPRPAGEARALPATLTQTETLDIQVFRNVTKLELTNTTARAFEGGTLWLNQRFSRPMEPLAIGESRSIPLKQFLDEFGEPFRGGGFFATEPPDRVVLVQLETEGTLYGLVVIGNRLQ